jgi:predicted dehydrogenase
MQSALRFAIIGLGQMGMNHVRVAKELIGEQLVAVAEPNRGARDTAESRFGVKTFADHRKMLAQVKPDAVCVAVPTQFHEKIGLDVLHAGCHLLLEKPIAMNSDAARRLIESAQSNNVTLMTGHTERYNPAVREMRRLLLDGEIGRPMRVVARRLSPGPGRVNDVGVVYDLATHDLDTFDYLLGLKPLRLYAETAAHTGNGREDVLATTIRYADDVIGSLDVNWLTPTKVRQLAVTGQGGMLMVDYLTQDLTLYRNDYEETDWQALQIFKGTSEGESVRLKVARQEPLRVEWEQFLCSIRGELAPGEVSSGLPAIVLAEAILESARESRMIEID